MMGNEGRELASEVIIAEYNYIAQTAFQANEDRARVSSVYTAAVASLIAAILSAQLNSNSQSGAPIAILVGFAIVFSVVSIFGFLTILQLIRLRLAWRESARAMNAIKRHAISNHRGMNEAILWTDSTLPEAFKPDSISFIGAVQVAIVSGVTFGAFVLYIGFILSSWWWIPAFSLGFLYAALQVSVYSFKLRM